MSKNNKFTISSFVGATMLVSVLILGALLVLAFFMSAISEKMPMAIAASILLIIVLSLVAMMVGFILKRLNFTLDSLFKYFILFVVSTAVTFITIFILELKFVTYTPDVLIGLSAVSIMAGIILTISGKIAIPKQ